MNSATDPDGPGALDAPGGLGAPTARNAPDVLDVADAPDALDAPTGLDAPTELDVPAGLDVAAIKARYFETGFVHIARSSPLSAADLLALAQSFGPLLKTERHTPDHPAIQIISEDGLFGDQDLPWHNDFSYGEGGFFGTLLCNRENGHIAATSFVDMEVACAALAPEERERLRAATGHYFLPADMLSDYYSTRQEKALRRQRSSRPLVFDHPATGRPVLYFSPGTLRRVTQGEADIEALIGHCECFAYDHRWQPHDVLLYDNFRMMHRRPPFEGRRTLWRIQFDPGYGAIGGAPDATKAAAG